MRGLPWLPAGCGWPLPWWAGGLWWWAVPLWTRRHGVNRLRCCARGVWLAAVVLGWFGLWWFAVPLWTRRYGRQPDSR
ncbi:hypothetical protein ACFQV2_23430 [Actinokineospora soli]|uniref:Uncharacterized protein n=1 Tax=Actinokineospora soli TaxID=1048753 RepID=A0ABW2TU36_9PSEU